jgi:hypothetical protein
MNQPEKYILVKGSSGLGNRILAAATAILYAQISGRKIIIDWTEGTYAPEGINAFPLLFDCPNVNNIEDLPKTDSIYPEIWRGNLNKCFGEMKEQLKIKGTQGISFNICNLNYEEEVLVFCSYNSKIHQMRNLFKGEFSNYAPLNNQEILKILLPENFSLQPKIKSKFDQFIKENFSSNTIGVHIRYSDMKVPLAKIYETVDRVKQKNKNSPIFLATDSQTIMEDFKNRYDDAIAAEKWYPQSGGTLHQNWHECEDYWQNGLEALQDLYLLGNCQTLIFSSQSSFGYIASLFNSQGKLYDIHQPSWPQKIIRQLKNSYRERGRSG